MSFFEFLTSAGTVFLRVRGQANMNNSHLFRELVDHLLERDYASFYVDLSDCEMIDSTFMGVLVGITMYEPEPEDHEPPPPRDKPRVMVINAREGCAKALEGVGLAALITINPEPFELPEGASFERVEDKGDYDPDKRIALILDAHRNLIAVDERNEAIFGPFLATLDEEFLRLE